MIDIVPDFNAHLPLREFMHKSLKYKLTGLTGADGPVANISPIRISSPMAIGSHIQAWRLSRGLTSEHLAAEAGISLQALDDIEAESFDPSTSTLERLAAAIKIPVAWLFAHPTAFQLLFQEPEDADDPAPDGPDPITERILNGSRMDRALYVMLTALIQSGEPKLLRAAEMSLKSLVKQSKQSTVPWQNRPSGHFEPPSD